MRIWLHSSAKAAALGPSATISVVAHVALIGAAVYGTGVRARAVEQAIAQRIYYLPPPDRRPISETLVERLQYMDVGAATPVTTERADGTIAAPAGTDKARKPGGNAGVEPLSQVASEASASPDSVYSILDVEESAVRSSGSAAPIYPTELMKDGKEGGVFIRFVVDTTGRADPASMEIVRSTHVLFSQSVQQALPLMLFTPAMVGGHRVRQAVEQNFEFRIAPAAPAEHTRAKPIP